MRKSEERYRYLYESAHDGIVGVDLLGRFTSVNKEVERISGYSRKELIGKNFFKLGLFPPQSLPFMTKRFKEAVQEGKHRVYEVELKNKQGKIVPVEIRGSPIKNEQNKVIGLQGIIRNLSDRRKIKELKEKVVRLAQKIPLTEKEKLVFYGLVRWPCLNDQRLSAKLKLKRPTVTAIKNKLKRQQFYTLCVIPNFAALGHELLTFVWGKSSIPIPLEDRPKIEPINKAIESPERLFIVSTDKEFLSLLILKNFTEFKRLNNTFSSVYKDHSAEEENVQVAHFPFEITQISPLFDYSSLLKNMLGLNIKEEKEEPVERIKPTSLSKGEQVLLYALTKWPSLSDSEIAKKISVSRQSVSKAKHKLLSQGLMTLVNKPNLKKLGCDLLVNLYCKFSSKALGQGEIEEINRIYPAVFRAMTEGECLSLSIFKNFVDFKRSKDELGKYLEEKNISIEKHQTFLIPIEEIKFERMDFAPLLKKSFGLKTDF